MISAACARLCLLLAQAHGPSAPPPEHTLPPVKPLPIVPVEAPPAGQTQFIDSPGGPSGEQSAETHVNMEPETVVGVVPGARLQPIEEKPAVKLLAPAPRYSGVVPGLEAHNPLPPPPKSSTPYLIWTGFHLDGGKSEVFLQTTGPVSYQAAAAPQASTPGAPSAHASDTLSVFLRNCRIHLRNNARRLDTRFFATAVEGVRAAARTRRGDRRRPQGPERHARAAHRS